MTNNFKLLFFDLRMFDGAQNLNKLKDNTNLPDEFQTYYDKRLIDLAGPNLIHDQVCAKRPIPKGNSRINFRTFEPLEKATTPLTEGVTPDGNTLVQTNVEGEIDYFGSYVATTDRLQTEALDPVIDSTVKLLASQAGRTLDTITREVMTAGNSVYFVPNISGGTETSVAKRSDLTINSRIRPKDISRVKTYLSSVNAPKIDGKYVALVHPHVSYDLRQNPNWIDVVKYKNPEKIYEGEIGEIDGVRFLESSECKIIAPSNIQGSFNRLTVKTAGSTTTSVAVNETLTAATGLSIPVYVNGAENTITAIGANNTITLASAATVAVGDMICGRGAGKDGSAVYCTMIVGQDAIGTSELEGGGLRTIVKGLGSAGSSDPLDQRATIGWKASKTAVRLVEKYMYRIESSSELGFEAKSN